MHLPWRDLAPGPGPAISTSLLPEEAAKLAELAKGGDVLEVGSAFGFSTVTMALVARNVTAVDPHTGHGSYEALHGNLDAYGASSAVEVLRGMSQVELPFLSEYDYRFDLAFIDGDHTAAAVQHDVMWALRLLKPGGILACHDFGEDCCCPDVRPTLDRMFPDGPDELVGTLFLVRP